MSDSVLITTINKRGVAHLTMNRPEIRNAFNEELISELCDAMGKLNSNPDVRAIVLTGSGNTFSGGADLNMMKRSAQYSTAENKDDARRLAHMLSSIYRSPKPTVALVNGPSMGGGVGLIAACDIAISVDTAFFALSEVRVGVVPAVISPFVTQAITPRQARRYYLTGERFDSSTAKSIGLLHIVTTADMLTETLDTTLDNLLACAPNAQKEAKSLIRTVMYRTPNDAVMEETAGIIARVRASTEGKEGIAAFLEKRKPAWIDKK